MSEQKINDILGIDNVQDYLKDLSLDDESIKSREDKMDEQLSKIDCQIQSYTSGDMDHFSFADISESMDELRCLINSSKQVIQHTLESIITSELPDSDTLAAFAKIIECTKLSLSEYINLFKDRLAFYDKVRFEAIKHKNDMEKIKYKHDLDMEKLNAKQGPAVEVTNNNVNAFSQEDVIKMIDKT